MALRLTTPPPFTLINLKQKQLRNQSHFHLSTLFPGPILSHHRSSWSSSSSSTVICSYKVVIEHDGESRDLEVEPDENILEKALDSGISVPHDCRLGVCMTCPAKLISGKVDQSEGMLSDDVIDRGYALLCASQPRSDCYIRTIPQRRSFFLCNLQLPMTDS